MKTYLLLNEAPCDEDVWESGDIAAHILNLGTTQFKFQTELRLSLFSWFSSVLEIGHDHTERVASSSSTSGAYSGCS
jgi:hypothetical protein